MKRLALLLCLALVSALGGLLSPLGDLGRRMRSWAEAKKETLG